MFLFPWTEGFPTEGIDLVGTLKTPFGGLFLHFHFPFLTDFKCKAQKVIVLTTMELSQQISILPFLFSQEGQCFRKQGVCE